jgi:hypothetical protein
MQECYPPTVSAFISARPGRRIVALMTADGDGWFHITPGQWFPSPENGRLRHPLRPTPWISVKPDRILNRQPTSWRCLESDS